MPQILTKNARLSAQEVRKKPSLVVEFEGIEQKFGSATILRVIRIGDDDLFIGNDWKIGGSVEVEGQESALTFDADFGSTTTKIDYKLNPDRGIGSSVSSLELAFVDDKADTILTIFTENEMLSRKCRIWLSPNADNTTFPEDYIIIFRGIVDGINASPGGVVLNVSHPDQKKRQTIFTSVETELDGAIDGSTTSVILADASDLLTPVLGPNGINDTSLKFYIRVDDEIIRYTGTSGNTLTGVVRGELGTDPVAHDDEASVTSFYTLEGQATDLALKLMLSGWNDYYYQGLPLTSVEEINPSEIVENAVFFEGQDLSTIYGITAGDYITVSGCSNGANNVTLKLIDDVVKIEDGTYLVVDDVSFVTENTPPSGAVVAFRSKYDTLGEGLRMSPDEVDVFEHERLRSYFLSSFEYLFYLTETIDSGKDFIEKQIYSPIACYSIPRMARASVGYHIGPLPTAAIPLLNDRNVRQPGNITKRRSTGKNFYNTIIYKFDKALLDDKYLQGALFTNAESREQIPIGTKALTIEADGLRNAAFASTNATRRLNRYAFGAEYFTSVKVFFSQGFNIEVGDLVLFDGTNLKIASFVTGLREGDVKLYEVISKSFNIVTGDISLELVDTNYSTAFRYALISQASFIKTGLSASSFIIQSSFESVFDQNEYEKWNRFVAGGLTVKVRNDDFSVVDEAGVDRFEGNTVFLTENLSFTPSAGMIMEMGDYPPSEQIKLIYGFIAENASGFSNGDEPYRML